MGLRHGRKTFLKKGSKTKKGRAPHSRSRLGQKSFYGCILLPSIGSMWMNPARVPAVKEKAVRDLTEMKTHLPTLVEPWNFFF
jgi:hypothetical protein